MTSIFPPKLPSFLITLGKIEGRKGKYVLVGSDSNSEIGTVLGILRLGKTVCNSYKIS